MSTENFEVNNVKCAGCANNIEQAIKSLPGVESVQVDITTGKVSVQGEADRPLLAQALAAAGYPEKT